MRHTLYEPEHEAFRDAVRGFVARHVAPFHDDWEKAGIVDRSVWVEAGKQGLLGTDVPEQYGGGGMPDFRYNCVVSEELTRAGASGVGFALHNDIVRRTCSTSRPTSRSSAGCPLSSPAS